jgi:hypothetical protein
MRSLTFYHRLFKVGRLVTRRRCDALGRQTFTQRPAVTRGTESRYSGGEKNRTAYSGRTINATGSRCEGLRLTVGLPFCLNEAIYNLTFKCARSSDAGRVIGLPGPSVLRDPVRRACRGDLAEAVPVLPPFGSKGSLHAFLWDVVSIQYELARPAPRHQIFTTLRWCRRV